MLHCLERLVRVLQGECDDTRSEIQMVSQGDEVARILPRHIGHAADLTLPPEKLVIVEGGHPRFHRSHSQLSPETEWLHCAIRVVLFFALNHCIIYAAPNNPDLLLGRARPR